MRVNGEAGVTYGGDDISWLTRIWQEGRRQGKGRGIHLPFLVVFWNQQEYIEWYHTEMYVRQ